MKIGITGGTGGLGQRLTEYLVAREHQVKALVRKTSQVDRLRDLGVELVFGDVTDPESLAMFVKSIDICYHLAAQVSSAPEEQLLKVNVEGTRNVCDAILRYNPACKLIYCSSIVVKGVRFYNRLLLSGYTMSKYRAEKAVDRYMKEKGLKASVIYPGYIYGPYDKNFMPSVIKMLQHGLPFTINGGQKNAPVVFIDDLCELFYLAGVCDAAVGKKYVSLKKNEIGTHGFLRMVAEKLNYPFPEKVVPKWPLVLVAFAMDKIYKALGRKSIPKINMRLIGALSNRARYFNDNAIKELGWDQRTAIPEGIERSLAWHFSNNG